MDNPQSPYGQSPYQQGPYGQQQEPYQQGPVQPKPDSWLAWAIVSTILCCLPAGIVAIVYAAKVDGLYMSGRYAEACSAAGKAKTWTIVSVICSVGCWVFYCLILAFTGGLFHIF